MNFILASESPRRSELLREAGFVFRTVPANLDEEGLTPAGLLAEETVLHLARLKAEAVSGRFPAEMVLAADTVVAIDGEALSKPVDADDARRMIQMLAGREHEVVTGLCACWQERGVEQVSSAVSIVRMRALSGMEVEGYLATNLWQGKAGGYGIQDPEPLVELVRGSFSNVMGLPMEEARALLARIMTPRG